MAIRDPKLRNKNRAWDVSTHVWVRSTQVAVVAILFVFGVAVKAILWHHCKALNREIVALEAEQRKLTSDLAKERVRWSQMTTPANLDLALNRHGIAMAHPSPLQVVYMEPTRVMRPRVDTVARSAYVSR